MSVELADLSGGHLTALREFFAQVPPEDQSFFKEDITAPGVAERWVVDDSAARVLALDGGAIVAFAALVPGTQRTSHVADLRLVVAANARRRGLGAALTRRALLTAVERSFCKVTVEVAADSVGAIDMFRDLGFEPEALLRDQLRDPGGELHDMVILAHAVDDNWQAMLTAGIDTAIG